MLFFFPENIKWMGSDGAMWFEPIHEWLGMLTLWGWVGEGQSFPTDWDNGQELYAERLSGGQSELV